MASRKLKIDFRTKLFMTIVLSYTLLLGNLPSENLLVAVIASISPYCLLFLERRYKEAIRGICLIVIAALLQKYLLNVVTGFLTTICLFMTILFLRMIPGLAMGRYTFMTSDMSEIVAALKKMKVPDQIIIPLNVMARFFYTTLIDYKQIKNAMYLHGFTTGRLIFKPKKFYEYHFVPLLMLLLRTADEVATSAQTRGLEVGAKRTSLVEPKFSFLDYFLFLATFVLIGFYIGGKYA